MSSFNLIVQGKALAMDVLAELAVEAGSPAIEPLGKTAWRFLDAKADTRETLAQYCRELECDWAFVPAGLTLEHFGLWMTDMDSTLIQIECIDEIAGLLGIKDKVSAITERSMAGELDFTQSLRERVALLAGLKESTLKTVYDKKVKLTPGARELIAACQAKGVKIGLISGGFTHFTNRLKEELGLDYAIANTLEVVHGRLTGQVKGPVIDAQAKADWLVKLRDELGLRQDQVIATGDGANDLQMLAAAGVGIAFHAKPVVRYQAHVALTYSGLDGVINLFAD